jgi:hypothetical protein
VGFFAPQEERWIMAWDYKGRPELSPEEKAQRALDQKASRAERKAQKEQEAKQHLEAAHRLFLSLILPKFKALESAFGETVVFDISPARFVASCRNAGKQGSLTVQLIVQPEADGSLTLTIEAVQGDTNPLSKRAGLAIAAADAVGRWIDEQLQECLRIHARLASETAEPPSRSPR